MMNYILSMLRNGQNPQQIAMQFLRNKQNPMIENWISLAQQGKTEELENIARNIVKQQGRDFDTEFRAFKQQFGALNK